MKNITIIGGGACGTALFIELLLQIANSGLSKESKITIIEKDGQLGQGLAFGTKQPGHLLNTQTELMGIHVHEPEHFSEWLKLRGGKDRKDVKGKGETEYTYTTRKLYGDYLSGQARYYVERAREKGIPLEVITAEAIDIQRDMEAYEVLCHNGRRIASDYIVLALGTPKPNNYKELLKYPQYIDFPWPSDGMINKVHADDHVGILGTSLSAIDAVMTLVDNGHQGKISLFSPDGMLPRVQPQKNKNYRRKYLTVTNIHKNNRETWNKVTVKALFRLFQREVEHCNKGPVDWKNQNREKKPAEKLLDQDISCAEKGGDELLTVIYSLRYDAGTVWRMLDIGEKKFFKKWLGSHWMMNRHAMPLYNAYRLRTLFKEKRLRVFPGLKEVGFNNKGHDFSLTLEGLDDQKVDKLINATGSSSHLGKMECRLLDSLLEKKYLSAYPVGGTLINELTMQAISPKGGEGIYALGHLVNGIMLDVNAVWFNVRTVAALTRDILFKIRYGSFS